MGRKRERADFVKWLESQLKAFRARRFEKLDVEAVGCELEAVVGRYRGEVRRRAERLIPILMRPHYVYGDWNDLKFEWDMLRGALEESLSLTQRAPAEIEQSYELALLAAELHGERRCPEECRHADYLALERESDADFGICAGAEINIMILLAGGIEMRPKTGSEVLSSHSEIC
jgi:hypothetical protein